MTGAPDSIRFDDFELRPAARELLKAGERVALGSRALDILVVLITQRHRLVEKQELLALVWPGMIVEDANVHVQVSNLRKALGPGAIATSPSKGYQFTRSVHSEDTDTAAKAAPLASNVPAIRPTLYGRDREQDALEALLRSNRLVTLAGPAGIGKSVLAKAVAHRTLQHFSDGAWLVEFAPVSDAANLASTVAAALPAQIPHHGGDSAESLARSLSSQRLLLILDNCEHLISAVAELVNQIVTLAPSICILATSQQPLKIAHERVYRLKPLALPTGHGFQLARASPAVALFEARATGADAEFQMDEASVGNVVEICRRLDGIPLAIELAAARVGTLGTAGLCDRLCQSLRLLAGADRLAPERHQTLYAALRWSYELLSEQEQAVFRRLGVFAGSFDEASAHRVAGTASDDPIATLALLGTLAEKSLLLAETGGAESRYRLYESHRIFATQLLAEMGELDWVRQLHAEAVLARFESSQETRNTLPSQVQTALYQPDLDNLRAALDWAKDSQSKEMEARLCAAGAWILFYGHRAEAMRRIDSALIAVGPDTDPTVEARLLVERVHNLDQLAATERQELTARAADLFRRAGRSQEMFVSLLNHAAALSDGGRFTEANGVLQRAESIFDPVWPRLQYARLVLTRLWLLQREGRYEEALIAAPQMIALAREIDDRSLLLRVLISEEQDLAMSGRLGESIERGRALLRMAQENRTVSGVHQHLIMVNLATSLARAQIIDEAVHIAEAAFPLALNAGLASDFLDLLAFLSMKQGRFEIAARALACADKHLSAGGSLRHPVEQYLRDATAATLLQHLPESHRDLLAREGQFLSIEACARLVLDVQN